MANMSFTNNAATTLASGITNVATSLTVATGTGALFPSLSGSQYFYCTLANVSGTVEIVKVTARSTDTFTIVRGQDNTSAVSWNSGDKCELRLVAASLNNFPKLDEANTFSGNNTFSGSNAYGTPASIVLTNATGLPIAGGGTGQTTAQAAMNSFAGAVTSGSYLRGNGTNVVMSTIQAADVPTLNQNTTGTSGGLTGTPNITVGTLQFNSGYGSSATAYGCRAWVNFGTPGGTPTINASANVSSITDNGTGNFTVNFTNSMPDQYYCITGAIFQSGNSGAQALTGGTGYSFASGSCHFFTRSSSAAYDPDVVCAVFVS
jgi:hypothetical protein